MDRIVIVGAGYVGLVSGVCLASLGHTVTCVDVNHRKIERILAGDCPIREPGLEPLLKAGLASGKFSATADLAAAVADADVTVIAVGTPFINGATDLSSLRDCAGAIGAALRRVDRYHVVAVKSTVVPGTADEIVLPILRDHSGKAPGTDFGVGVTPEFLREGSAVADFLSPDRIVCGGLDSRTADVLARIWSVFVDVPLIRTNNRTAEMIKYASNSLLATLISFSNELANICQQFTGVDVVDVTRGLHLDRRLGWRAPDGNWRPAGVVEYLAAGCGFGGSCLPKDLSALIAESRARRYEPALLQAVASVNDRQPSRMISLLKRRVPELHRKVVGVLGATFKAGTDDIRESPTLRIVDLLRQEGAEVAVFDPLIQGSTHPGFDGARFVTDLDELAREADALMLVTNWPSFKALEQIVPKLAPQPVVIDGRRMLDKSRFARYEGIGLESESD